MELHAIFITSIGIVNETNSLKLAQKIFVDNKDILTTSLNSPNFKTTIMEHHCESAVIKKYVNDENINQLKEIIAKNAFTYLQGTGYDEEKFDLKVPNLWLNEMQSESYSQAHSHYGYNLSGTYYVEMPENSGSIFFTNPVITNTCPNNFIKNYTAFNSGKWEIKPKEGDMIFWKSDLVHSVPPVKFEGVRKSIAFDVLITPKN
jgi:uncharacterized protein (TIGR02466 family)